MTGSFLHELIEDRVIICPFCQSDQMQITPNRLHCHACGSHWPVRNSVPDVFNNYNSTVVQPPSSDTPMEADKQLIELIISQLGLHRDKHYNTVKEIVNRAGVLSCADNAQTAEIRDLQDRFLPSESIRCNRITPPDANKNPLFLLERHYLPPKIIAGSSLTTNFRITNTGQHPWSSKTGDPIYLCLYWTRKDGTPVGDRVQNVPFPVDIAPGRSITLPVRTNTPSSAGTYWVHICLADKNNRIITRNPCCVECKVTAETIKDNFLKRFKKTGNPVTPSLGKAIADYGKDHAKGRELFTAALEKRGKPTRVLEIGSGPHPQTAWIPDNKVAALDISSPLLELGSLFFAEKHLASTLAFICADAFCAPFKKNSFDAIAMFSTLHHFPEPEKILKRITPLLKKNGFIAVMCEPVNDTLETPETIRDLEKGINEQAFSWQEYVQIFHTAHLNISCLHLDGGSLKAILHL
jgi:ubiquinone/menaquinone biosynthesis C-methylase UbiE/uncharacterized protein YbaR (Trm112 family)